MRRWVAAVLGGWAWLSGGEAAAQERAGVRAVAGKTGLEYVRGAGAEGCPDEGVFRYRTLGGFGQRSPFVKVGEKAPVVVRVVIARKGVGFEGVMMTVDAEGRVTGRSVEAYDNCDGLVWSLAYAMNMVIQPFAPAPCPRCPATGCDSACMERVEKEVCRKYGRCMDLALTVMAGGLFTFGATLDAQPGAWLGFDVQHDWWSLGAEVRGAFPAAAQRYYASPPNSDLATFSGLLTPCARWKWLFGCAFVEVGALLFTVPGGFKGDIVDPMVALGPRAGVQVPIAGGFSVRAFADLAIHPVVTTADIQDFNDPDLPVRRWELPVVRPFFGLGLAWSH